MKKEKRKWQIFGVLVILLGISIYANLSGSRTEGSAEIRLAPLAPSSAVSQEEIVDIRQLDRKIPRVRRIERNLFQFEGGRTRNIEIPERSTPEVTEAKPPVEEVPKVRYLGMYIEKKENGRRLAAVSNSGRIFVGEEGDVLGGKYRILRIASDHLLLQLTSDERKFRVSIGQGFVRFVD